MHARTHIAKQTRFLRFFQPFTKESGIQCAFLGKGWPLQSCSITLPHPIISHNFCANDAVTARSKLHCSYPASPARSTLECTRLAPCVVVALLDLGQLTPSVLWQVRFGIMCCFGGFHDVLVLFALYQRGLRAPHQQRLAPGNAQAARGSGSGSHPPAATGRSRPSAWRATCSVGGGGSGYSNGSLQVRT